jgi:tRNA threonylcarbamoyladenosine biosynthesis protein TsaE
MASGAWRFPSPKPEDTRRAARALAAAVDARGLVVSLAGPLGAGKTVFAKGLAEGLGLDAAGVASPTFVIASEYPTPDGRRFVHVDLYRVESRGELETAGFADWLDPGNLVAVEWGDRFPGALPADRLEVAISRVESGKADDRRLLHALSSGPISAAVLARWRAAPTVRTPESPQSR